MFTRQPQFWLEKDEVAKYWQRQRRAFVRQYRVNGFAKLLVKCRVLWNIRRWYLKLHCPAADSVYRPLGPRMIRLLRIRPGHSFSFVDCELLYMDLAVPVKYTALSYCWQSRGPKVSITLNSSAFEVSEDLLLALLHLRKRRIQLVWVDAICINQNDHKERAAQVRQMGRIYHQAQQVVAWLGDSNKLTSRAFNHLHGMLHMVEDTNGIFWGPLRIETLGDILIRSWFRRVWVLQEVILAKRATIVCGEDCIHMSPFLALIKRLDQSGNLSMILSHCLGAAMQEPDGIGDRIRQQLKFLYMAYTGKTDDVSHHRTRRSLLMLLSETRYAEATDPRDKVYGIMGLIEESTSYDGMSEDSHTSCEPDYLAIDYDASDVEVSINATKEILNRTGSLEVLHLVHIVNKRDDRLPSWVPHWASNGSQQALNEKLPYYSSDEDRNDWQISRDDRTIDTKASSEITDQVTEHCGPWFCFGNANSLIVKGIIFDTIDIVSLYTLDGTLLRQQLAHLQYPKRSQSEEAVEAFRGILDDIRKWIEEWRDLAAACSTQHQGQSTLDAFCDFLSGISPTEASEAFYSLKMFFEALSDVRSMVLHALEPSRNAYHKRVAQPSDSRDWSDYDSAVETLGKCMDKSFVRTGQKQMGLVPPNAQAGDLICVVYGSMAPLILRRAGEGTFRFIGHGRIQGLDYDDFVVENGPWRERRSTPRRVHSRSVDASGRRSPIIEFKQTRLFEIV